ncbi:hypothetical protein H2248_000615, partial [Termitomyces sp. 'cryptogamus']
MYPDTVPGTDSTIGGSDQTPSPAIMQTLCRLTRLARPTSALIAAQETLQREQDMHEEGEDWASAEDQPMAMMAESPYSYLLAMDAREEMNIPKTYIEAMKRSNLWQPANEELRVMEEQSVFELMNKVMV